MARWRLLVSVLLLGCMAGRAEPPPAAEPAPAAPVAPAAPADPAAVTPTAPAPTILEGLLPPGARAPRSPQMYQAVTRLLLEATLPKGTVLPPPNTPEEQQAINKIAIARLTQMVAIPQAPARLTVSVVDEAGAPIPDAEVTLSLSDGTTIWSDASSNVAKATGTTDAAGQWTGTVRGNGHECWCGVQKAGYYHNGAKIKLGRELQDGQWVLAEPLAPIVLVQEVPPVPMYVHRVETSVPIMEAPVGYDLMKGDWLAPHGKGEVADLELTAHRNANVENDCSVTITFVGGGVQRGTRRPNVPSLKLDPVAPADGYQPMLTRSALRTPEQYQLESKDPVDDHHYYFTIGSRPRGGQAQLLYGKICGGIGIGYRSRKSENVWVQFLYYLNPTGERVVVFDSKNDLYPDDAQQFSN